MNNTMNNTMNDVKICNKINLNNNKLFKYFETCNNNKTYHGTLYPVKEDKIPTYITMNNTCNYLFNNNTRRKMIVK